MLRRWRHRVVGIEIPTLQSPMSRKFENKLARVCISFPGQLKGCRNMELGMMVVCILIKSHPNITAGQTKRDYQELKIVRARADN